VKYKEKGQTGAETKYENQDDNGNLEDEVIISNFFDFQDRKLFFNTYSLINLQNNKKYFTHDESKETMNNNDSKYDNFYLDNMKNTFPSLKLPSSLIPPSLFFFIKIYFNSNLTFFIITFPS
jgi:hypothetical protein